MPPASRKVEKAPVFGVVEPIVPGTSQVKPSSCDTFKLATCVVEVTTSGGVPMAMVEISWVPVIVEFATMVPVLMAGPFPVTQGPVACAVVPSQTKAWTVTEFAALAIVHPPLEFDGQTQVCDPPESWMISQYTVAGGVIPTAEIGFAVVFPVSVI